MAVAGPAEEARGLPGATPEAKSGAVGPNVRGLALEEELARALRGDVRADDYTRHLYAGDASPGDENGQNINAYGGIWRAVAPSGDVITAAAPSGNPSGY